MKKILSTTAIASSMCLLGTSAFAQFVGPYAGISISSAGFGTEASKTSSNANSTGSGNGPVGAIFPLAAIDIGYSIAAGKGTTVAIGATYTPLKAEFDGKSNDTGGLSHKFEVKDGFSVYLQPTFNINKDAAAFVKAFYSHADVSATNLTTSPGDLEGYGASVGLRVMLTKDAYMQVEGVYTQYDTIKATRTSVGTQIEGNSLATITRTFTAQDPKVAEGRITLGMKF